MVDDNDPIDEKVLPIAGHEAGAPANDDDDDDGFDDDDDLVLGPGPTKDDGKAEAALDVLSTILEHMDFEGDVSITEDSDKVYLEVAGEDAGRIIGKKGQTLDALQFLVNKIVNRFPEGRRHVILDVGGYRQRHHDGLVKLARSTAHRAVREGMVIGLEPLPPQDRRVIHLALAKFPGVTTKSEGEGANRRLQVIPANVRESRGNQRGRGGPPRGRGGPPRGGPRGGSGGGSGGPPSPGWT
ncbi:MAG: KH domain-containing protein [Deltaproteobacteria bacterium]|nr:KH domain-containing protein [Deltaproteobacteria bacterium]